MMRCLPEAIGCRFGVEILLCQHLYGPIPTNAPLLSIESSTKSRRAVPLIRGSRVVSKSMYRRAVLNQASA